MVAQVAEGEHVYDGVFVRRIFTRRYGSYVIDGDGRKPTIREYKVYHWISENARSLTTYLRRAKIFRSQADALNWICRRVNPNKDTVYQVVVIKTTARIDKTRREYLKSIQAKARNSRTKHENNQDSINELSIAP